MEGMLKGKVVLVTGSGRGVGKDIAFMAAQHGAKVMVNDLGSTLTGEGGDVGVAEAAAQEIRDAGGVAAASAASVTDRKAVAAMIDQCMNELGGLDYVVNNAGICRDHMFHKMSDEEWDSVIDVHLNGTYNVSRAAAAVFREQGSGCFLHMTSTSGLIGNLGQANYMAAKLGIAAISRSISLDMARFGVRSNCLAPFAWSRMTESIPSDGAKDNSAHIANVKKMESAKIAPLVIALGADSCDVSGQIFAVRGNDITLMSQPRPVCTMHRSEGWTPETVLRQALPALEAQFTPAEVSRDVFCWDVV